jgi:hypothetical protein
MTKQRNIDRYSNLVESVIQKTAGYESSFLEDEDYAMVDISYSISSFIPSYVNWMLTKEASEDDINLIDVSQFSSYQIIPPPPEEEEPVELDAEDEVSEIDNKTEITFPEEIIFEERDFLPPISLSDRPPLPLFDDTKPIIISNDFINLSSYQSGNTYGYTNTGFIEPTKPFGTGNYTGERRTASDGSSWVWIPFQGGWTRA